MTNPTLARRRTAASRLTRWRGGLVALALLSLSSPAVAGAAVHASADTPVRAGSGALPAVAIIAGGDYAEAPALGVAGAELRRDGRTAVVRIVVPGAGDVRIGTTSTVSPGSKGAAKAGLERAGAIGLGVKLSPAAAKTLERKGEARVTVAFTYTPAGGTPQRRTAALTIER
jgi:hypothetical protein